MKNRKALEQVGIGLNDRDGSQVKRPLNSRSPGRQTKGELL